MRRMVHKAATVSAPVLAMLGLLSGGAGAPSASGAAFPNGVEAWGGNTSGQLGNGSLNPASVPTVVNGLGQVQQISAGNGFALALLKNGNVMAWGDNTHGQLGNGTTTNSAYPVPVTGLPAFEVRGISAGGDFSLALLKNGTVMAWGDNALGQLGNGTTTDSSVPVAVPGLTGVQQVQGGGTFSLAVEAGGTVSAWGDNTHGELGNGSLGGSSAVPAFVTGLGHDVKLVSAGGDFSLALMIDGTVTAWGAGAHGQLGNGTTADSDVPVFVSGLTFVRTVAAGGSHALAILPLGRVAAWGANANGEIGNGTTTDSDLPIVLGLSNAAALAAGATHSLVLLGNRTVEAWGDNANGELGDGTTTQRVTPVAVPSITGVTGISAGAGFSLDKGMNLAPVISARTRIKGAIGLPLATVIRVHSHPTYATIGFIGTLPAGLTFTDRGNDYATITGTPGPGSAGTYTIQVTATTAVGGTKTLVVRIAIA